MESTFEFVFTFVLGAVIGSFLNVCIVRLPEGVSVVAPSSRCPICGQGIRWYDNIPILSYLVLRGRCRSCGDPVSVRYPLVEMMTALMFAALWTRFGFGIPWALYAAFVSGLIVVTFVDLAHQIIPDVVSLPGICVGFVASFFLPGISWTESLLGILIGGGLLLAVAEGYRFLRKKEGMGGGDIKLLAMIGAFLGWKSIPVTIFIASFLGALVGGLYLAVTRKGTQVPIPFGPYLVMGALLDLFWGDELIDWYLSLGSMV